MTRRRRARLSPGRGPARGRAPAPRAWPWLAAAAGAAAVLCLCIYVAPGPRARRDGVTDVVLSPGLRLPAIARVLNRAGVIHSASAFIAAAELTGAARSLKAGEYRFSSGASLRDILTALRGGKVVRRFVTIPEGVTSRVVAEILDHTGGLSGDALTPPEGSILPETYEVRRGESRSEIVGRMRLARDALLNGLWADRSGGLPYATPEEAVTLASVVEKETALAAERPHIAAVFINRLRAGMRLESDPTVIYGLTGGAPLAHGLTRAELASRSPYNTYLVGGLPPTPIGNPGRAALTAALAPAESADLYFVADGTGGHVFSSDYQTHLRHVARWRALEQARALEARP